MNPRVTTGDLPMLEDALHAFRDAVSAAARGRYPGSEVSVGFEAPRRAEFGDFASNVAFSLAKIARQPPQAVAELLSADVAREAPRLREAFYNDRTGGGLRQSATCAASVAGGARSNLTRGRAVRRRAEQRRARLARVRQRKSDRTARRRSGALDVDRRNARKCAAFSRL